MQLDHEVLEEGKVWVDSLKPALEAVDLILILVSPDFLYSQSANFGAGMAISLQSPERRVIPILWRGVSPDSLPFPLRRLRAVVASSLGEAELLRALDPIFAVVQSPWVGRE